MLKTTIPTICFIIFSMKKINKSINSDITSDLKRAIMIQKEYLCEKCNKKYISYNGFKKHLIKNILPLH